MADPSGQGHETQRDSKQLLIVLDPQLTVLLFEFEFALALHLVGLEQPGEKVKRRDNDAKDEGGSKTPALVQGSPDGRPNQTANSETHGGDPKLTSKGFFWDGVTPTRNDDRSITFWANSDRRPNSQ